ncbi:MAG: histone deacetylase [Planctomycetes bacterium]|nr:histone deacetylase [Planctomycetota bacterium]
MAVGWIYDCRFLHHDTGSTHVERPQRLSAIVRTLQDTGLLARLKPLAFQSATPRELTLVHEPAYVDLVRMMAEQGFSFVGSSDTRICDRSYDVAALAVGGVLSACDHVAAGTVRRAFCAIRPPGHHAESDRAMGFCLFNNVAIAAEHLVRDRGLSRVAIVDFDAHHGNGTQRIFERRPDVLYISLHEHPASLVFPGTGHAEETGTDAGSGYTVNIPLDRGGKWAQYRHALECQVLPALDRFQPQFLLLSAGFDALMWDGTSHLSLEPECYGPLTQALLQAADRHAEGRVVSVLEGGYDLGQLGEAVAAHVRELVSEATA